MLSHIRSVGCFYSGTISIRSRRSQTLSLAASDAATYSPSVVEVDTHCWWWLLHRLFLWLEWRWSLTSISSCLLRSRSPSIQWTWCGFLQNCENWFMSGLIDSIRYIRNPVAFRICWQIYWVASVHVEALEGFLCVILLWHMAEAFSFRLWVMESSTKWFASDDRISKCSAS